ncbi:unnamed protein product [Pleuronectes platessa]|uniref:Ig-like domain-containing protein n=1 Tax=Pleuronectes platessa TaxID=8262 RepID=A0A9N7VSL8_PLEPL|nr:unnamed protein product [Pleuronectes platessa]
MRRASWICWQRADQQLRRFPFMSGWTCSGMEVPGDFPVRRPHRGHRRDELALCGRHVGRRLCGQMNPIIDPNTRSGVEQFVHLPELPPPSLSLTPDNRQMFSGECFTLQCLTSQTNSSGWKLVHFSPDLKAGTSNLTVHYSPPGGSMSPYKSEAFVFTAASGTSGVYWWEGARGRSKAVNITVSYGDIILKTQASPEFTGDDVTLCCQYQSGKHKQTSFFKNRALIDSNSSSGSDRVIKMTLKNVTQEDEGFYRCASHDRQLQSSESWLSVRPDRGQLNIITLLSVL